MSVAFSGAETGIDIGQANEAAREQARAAEQHQREDDFQHDKRAAQSAARPAFGAAARSLLERFVYIAARREPRRRDAEEQAGHHTERRAKR